MIGTTNRLSRSDTSPRQRASVLLAALLLTVLQVFAVSHLISHAASGDTGSCEVCLNAVHGGDALVAAANPPPAFRALVGWLVLAPELQVSSRTPTVYRARGPPSIT